MTDLKLSVMQNKVSNISCCVIGDDSLSAACIEHLLARGDKIVGICTLAAPVINWANKNHVKVLNNLDELVQIARKEPFDYLFSIANKRILSNKVLKLAKKLSINFHNAPLPRYSGAHPTTWALLQQEKQFGITWHIMTEVIDGGDILKQKIISINEQDTTATLNIKCYDAAVETFKNLINDLVNEQVIRTKQQLNQRLYFEVNAKPLGNGIISWSSSAQEIYALYRALNFGQNDNTFALPKIKIGEQFFIVNDLDITANDSFAPPGTIVVRSKNYIQVSTKTKDILIKQLINVTKKQSSLRHIIREFNLKPNQCLLSLSHNELINIQKYSELMHKNEKFWLKALLERKDNIFNKLLNSIGSNINFNRKLVFYESEIIDFEHKDFTININNGIASFNEQYSVVLTIILIYFYRINNYENYTVNVGGYSTELEEKYNNLYATHVPLTTDFNPHDSFYEAFHQIQNILQSLCFNNTFSRDIYFRYLELNGELADNLLSITIVDDLNTDLFNNDALVNLIIHRNKKQCKLLFLKNNKIPYFLKNTSNHITVLGTDIFQEPNKKIKDLKVLSKDEYEKVIFKWNATNKQFPTIQSIINLFEQQVALTPYQIAIQFYDDNLDYITLNKKANQLANYLIKSGVKEGDFIVIVIERSIEMIIAILATLKAGGAYVPIDISYSKSGIEHVIDDCNPRFLLTTKETYDGGLDYNIDFSKFSNVININGDDYLNIQTCSTISPNINVSPDNLAYIIYTSGTTGKAKGVKVAHKSLINLVYAMKAKINITTNERILLFSSFSFDGSVWEIFNPLCSGATICLVKEQDLLPVAPLMQTLKKHEITLAVLPAAVLNLLPYFELPKLKMLFSVGEACTKGIIQNWANKVTLINGYGPTEATVCTTMAYYKLNSSPKYIGKPIFNAKIYILDIFASPLPIGIPGEIYIGGAILAMGYLNRSELTKQHFIMNPFNNVKKDIIYKTGDLGYWLPASKLYYLGRTDKQVKIRGFRIELEAIENILNKNPLVKSCVVVTKTNTNGSKLLVAYIVPVKEEIETYLLQKYLKEHLPVYMVPQTFVFLEQFPLNKGGKVAVNLLPTPTGRERLASTLYVEPRTDLEKQLTSIWLKVLDLNEIGVYDNFFDVGGHSLLIAQLLLTVSRELNKNIALHDFLVKPTIEYMAKIIADNGNNTIKEKQSRSLQLNDIRDGLKFIDNLNKPNEFSIEPDTNEAILLTGVTGFVGKYVLHDLSLHSTFSTKIYCLIRAKNIQQAAKRLRVILSDNLFSDLHKVKIDNIIPIIGDFSQDLLGLEQEQFNILANEISIIYHIGAIVNHLYNYEQLRKINVMGTLELIKFATINRIKKINYISTLSAITEKNNDEVIVEDFIKYNKSIFNITDGYSQTKCVSEILLGHTKNIGIPVDIFRLGWLVWDDTTNEETIKNNHLYSLINACLQIEYAPNWKTKLNLMPVKFVGKIVVLSGLEKTTKHRVFNLVNPNTIAWNKIINSLVENKTEIRYITPKQWHKKCLNFFGKHNTLFPFLPLYLDIEKSIRLKAPDLGDQVQHELADKQTAKLKMQYPIMLPFRSNNRLEFFELSSYLQNKNVVIKKVDNYILEVS